MPAMIGGGKKCKTWICYHGTQRSLFLDELPEFPRSVLDSLRQPLEDKQVTIDRANAHVTYPANFQLIAAMNPCRCGHLCDASRSFHKAPRCAIDYRNIISGPLLDRIDICVETPRVSIFSHEISVEGESTESIRQRVIAERKIQTEGYNSSNVHCNAEIDGGEVFNKFAQHDQAELELLKYVLKEHTYPIEATRVYQRLQEPSRILQKVNK